MDSRNIKAVFTQLVLMVTFILALKVWAHQDKHTCSDGEYFVNDQCCPMCPIGQRVARHCDARRGTNCLSCIMGTYMDHPSGSTECFKCVNCDPGLGLQEVTKCSYTSNTVCDCANGYYCVDIKADGCAVCSKHSVAVPGEKVKRNGTTRDNRVIEKCPYGTFSAVYMAAECTKWKDCAALGLLEVNAGNSTSDAVCREKSSRLWLSIIPFVLVLLLVIVWIVIRKGITSKSNISELHCDNHAAL